MPYYEFAHISNNNIIECLKLAVKATGAKITDESIDKLLIHMNLEEQYTTGYRRAFKLIKSWKGNASQADKSELSSVLFVRRALLNGFYQKKNKNVDFNKLKVQQLEKIISMVKKTEAKIRKEWSFIGSTENKFVALSLNINALKTDWSQNAQKSKPVIVQDHELLEYFKQPDFNLRTNAVLPKRVADMLSIFFCLQYFLKIEKTNKRSVEGKITKLSQEELSPFLVAFRKVFCEKFAAECNWGVRSNNLLSDIKEWSPKGKKHSQDIGITQYLK